MNEQIQKQIFSHILVSISTFRQFQCSKWSAFNSTCISSGCFSQLSKPSHIRFANVIPLPAKYLFLFLCKSEFSPVPSLKGKWWVLCVCGLHCRSEVITYWWLCFHFSAQLTHTQTDRPLEDCEAMSNNVFSKHEIV